MEKNCKTEKMEKEKWKIGKMEKGGNGREENGIGKEWKNEEGEKWKMEKMEKGENGEEEKWKMEKGEN